MSVWVMLTFLYAIFNGFFECAKKKALEKNAILEILAWLSLIACVISGVFGEKLFEISILHLSIIFLKSTIIIVSWLLSLYALKRMSVSLYSVIRLSEIVFTICFSLLFLGEKLTVNIVLGMLIVLTGIFLVNRTTNSRSQETSLWVLFVLIIACLLNTMSAIIDKKILMSITSQQMQFWFCFFLTIGYWLILLVKNKKSSFEVIKKNYWIIIAAICLVVGDRFLFIANEIPESKVAVMTILKQLKTIEIIILGKIIFNEKNIIKKLLCSILIILGIVITLV